MNNFSSKGKLITRNAIKNKEREECFHDKGICNHKLLELTESVLSGRSPDIPPEIFN